MTTANLRDEAIRLFQKHFNYTPSAIARAPGRVNLIGEHTDYNDGFVLPLAIDRAIWVAFAPRNDDRVRIVNANMNHEQAEFALDELSAGKPTKPVAAARWSNYARGVAWVLQGRGLALRGFDGVLIGDVPVGAGLSSSAAVELAYATAFRVVSGFSLPQKDMALLAQKAENDFVGNRCGIMDQFISALGQTGHALLIDCRDLSYKLVPLPEGVSVVVCNSMVKRGLVDSEYNTRRAECEAGVAALRRHKPNVRALRDVTEADLKAHASELKGKILNRCRHVVSENARVAAMVAALEKDDTAALRGLLEASHASLRDDYEVSCKELDTLVAVAAKAPGYLGARLTGAGFGGCTVNLVKADRVTAFSEAVSKGYKTATGKQSEIHVCSAADGAGAERLA
jgi:galactokinase